MSPGLHPSQRFATLDSPKRRHRLPQTSGATANQNLLAWSGQETERPDTDRLGKKFELTYISS
jgi:hypothetical protein